MTPDRLEILRRADWRGRPVMVWGNPPAYGAELTPAEARALAEALRRAADETDTAHARTLAHGPRAIDYPLHPVTLPPS